ncbi:hypothetical protein V8C86DRAFT_521299 [Haematococcus lacustris]
MLGSGKLPAVPCCPICCDFLGACGGPATLPCGHNGCRNCLAELQQRPNPACPLCRSPVPAGFILVPNTELRDLVSLATSMLLTDERVSNESAQWGRRSRVQCLTLQLACHSLLPSATQA